MRSLDRRFPIALEADYFARLRRALSGEAIAALVLPYSYQLTAAATAGLTRALERILGPPVALSLAAPLPQGAEDDLQPWLGPRPAHVVIAVFALTATPERETHGAFVRALAAQAAPIRRIVLVDESGFRQRFTGADGARRLDERHGAWKRMLGETNVEPVFLDLTSKS
jgi:hypothetical protein